MGGQGRIVLPIFPEQISFIRLTECPATLTGMDP